LALLHATQFAALKVITVNPTLTTAYTVPAGDRIILRSVAMRNLLTTGTLTAYVYLAGLLIESHILAAGGAAGSDFEWRPWIVMTPGQLVQLAVSNATGADMIVSGSLYTI
jgi:hypothetical protein